MERNPHNPEVEFMTSIRLSDTSFNAASKVGMSGCCSTISENWRILTTALPVFSSKSPPMASASASAVKLSTIATCMFCLTRFSFCSTVSPRPLNGVAVSSRWESVAQLRILSKARLRRFSWILPRCIWAVFRMDKKAATARASVARALMPMSQSVTSMRVLYQRSRIEAIGQEKYAQDKDWLIVQ